MQVLEVDPLPEAWLSWSKRYPIDSLPLEYRMKIDFVYRTPDAGTYEPKVCPVTIYYTVYFVSNEHLIIHALSVGRNYMFADRIRSEMKFELTQTGSTKENLLVKFEGKSRTTILKAIGPLKSYILGKMHTRFVESIRCFWEGTQQKLCRTLEERLREPIKRSPKGVLVDPLAEVKNLILSIRDTNEFERIEREL